MKLRFALVEDIAEVYGWRNHPEVRRYSFNSNKLTFEEHDNWFRSKLGDDSTILLMAEVNSNPSGIVRFDVNDDEVEIGVYLNPMLFGLGMGSQLIREGIKWLRSNKKEVKNIRAKILSENIASQKAFEKVGFVETHSEYVFNIDLDK